MIHFNVEQIPGLEELWTKTLGDPQICIAILDGPVDQSHPSLCGAKLTLLETLVSYRSNNGSASQHGTHITSIIFGQHDGPVKGIAPECRGLIVPIFKDGEAGGIAPCSQVDLARAISQSVQAGAQIINISGGELTPSDSAHPLLADTVRECSERGVLIVAAAGNQGCNCLHIPGSLPSVLAVGAMDSKGNPLEFSNWGEKYQTQGILAPGENILGAVPISGTATNTGTSYATPIVSGIAALLLSLQLKRGERPNPHTIRNIILSSSIGCEEQPVTNCQRLLAGRLNIKRALTTIIPEGGTMQKSTNNQEKRPPEIIADAEFQKPASMAGEVATRVAAAIEEEIEEFADTQQSPPASMLSSQQNENLGKKETVDISKVKPSECGCGGVPSEVPLQPHLVFSIGQLRYDFGNEARLDSIKQNMASEKNPNPNPHDPMQLLKYFDTNPWEAASVIWTLNFDATPIYAIQGQGAFSRDVYQRLREFLGEQTEGKIERISVAGHIVGQVRLMTGQVVPVIWPELRCMYSWNTMELIKAICGDPPTASAKSQEQKAYTDKCEPVFNFLERVYHELRNLGTDPCQRAINYSATNALNAAHIFESALKDNMQLDAIECERSPICRPESDCWDVKLIFFDPENQLTRARKIYRFTVDVSDVCPVMVGEVRSWYVR